MSSDNSSKIEGIERMAEMLEAGRLTHEEFEQLKAELLVQDAPNPAVRKAPLPQSETAGPPPASYWIPTSYWISFAAGLASVLMSTFGIYPIAAISVSLYALLRHRVKRKRWMPWLGLVLGVLYLLVYLTAYGYIG